MTQQPGITDMFADMAAGMDGGDTRPDMEPVPAPKLPPRRLPIAGRDDINTPPPCDKLDSAEKLRQRVTELRNHYEPFLRDLTPPNPEVRPTADLKQFAFRMEEAEDRADAQRPFTDAGSWDEVTIPHFRGPSSPWVGYYRTTFEATEELLSRGRLWLRFKGVDYRCRVFVNGHCLGEHEGLFAPFGFDITDVVHRGEANQLLVRVENDAPQKGLSSARPWKGYGHPKDPWGPYGLRGDKLYGGTGQGWDSPYEEDGTPGKGGWTHCPPGAGIWQPVYLEARTMSGIDDLFVRPLPDSDEAELWMETWRSEFSRSPTAVDLTVFPNNFEGAPIHLGHRDLAPAGPWRSVYKMRFFMPEFKWWTQDQPHLYTLRVRLISKEDEGETIDSQDVTFGMRTIMQDTTSERKGTFYLNGEPLVLRGTNEMGNLSVPIQHGNPEQTIEDLLIGKAAHLNFWRITQRPVQSEVYDLCDRLGVLFQTDLPMVAVLRQGCFEKSTRQAGEMEKLVRRHPAAALNSLINEPNPDKKSESYRNRVVDRATLERFFEVCLHEIHLYNPDRIVKCADGDYFPPPRHGMLDEHAYVCMHEDHGVEVGKLHKGELFDVKKGWRCGVGEYGAEGLEPLETMRKHYPRAWLPEHDEDTTWTPDRIPKCQTWGWHHQWHDEQDTIRDWIAASHRHQAWAISFMHEGFRRRADIINSTTLHLLINAYPNNWLKAVCSVDREPLPGYFALADANTPLAVNLRTDRHAVTGGDDIDVELWLLNDLPTAPTGLRTVYRVEIEGKTAMIDRCDVAVQPADAAFQGRFCWTTPKVDQPTPLTVVATLLDADDTVVHDYRLELTVWPAVDQSILAGKSVAILGVRDGVAWQLAEAFGATPTFWHETERPDLVISESAAAALGAKKELDAYLEGGGALYALPQPGGTVWPLGADGVKIVPHRNHQFVSRKTGHPVVDGFDPFHFSLWYDERLDRITHLLKDGFLEGDSLCPITLTGTGVWYQTRRMTPATAELRIGKGTAIIDQVRAAERCAAEPRAAVYLQRVLRYLMDSDIKTQCGGKNE